jgi:tetratricopeptide (TPR) repeat protein
MRIILLSIIFCFAFEVGFSQTMKTKKWRRTEVDSLNDALLMMDEGNNYLAYPIIENIYNNHPKETFLKYTLGKLSLTRSDKYDQALKLLEESYQVNPKIDNIHLDLARAYHYNYYFDKAEEHINQFLSQKKITPEDKALAEQVKNYIQNAKEIYAHPISAKVMNIGPHINTNWDEYVPVITTDEATMIFTYRGEKSKGGRQNASLLPDPKGIFFEDVYMSEKVLGKWSEPVSIETINTNSHDAAIAMSPDGYMLFIYKDDGITHGDIYVSYNIGNNEFTPPQLLKGQVNSYSWEGSCSITADGKTLYFSSERPGGYGGKDIYKATLLPDSTWGNVVNLGPAINTPFDEDAPFIHPDGLSLYFSSKGHNSMGDYDIFIARMDVSDSTFKNVENIGYPINTPADDIYFVLSASGEHGYYSSARPDGVGLKDIYLIETNFDKKPVSMLVYGAVFKDEKATPATLTTYIIKDGKEEIFSKTKTKDKGKYLINLPAGYEFKIECRIDSNFFEIFTISTKDLKEYKEKLKLFKFETTTPSIAQTNTTAPTPTISTSPTPNISTSPTLTETLNPTQKETFEYSKNYGNISAEGLIFRVQIAAYKYPNNYTYDHLKGLGKVETVKLEDGLTRFTIGGDFKTLDEAFQHNLKVIRAGQKDAFVLAIYKDKRVYLSDLVKMGIYVKKDEQLAKEVAKEHQSEIHTTPSVPKEKTESQSSTFSNKIDVSGITLNSFQQKIFNYSEKYGNATKENLWYSVQIGVSKNSIVTGFNNVKKISKIETHSLDNGLFALHCGHFKTLNEALEFNKKIIQAGVKDAFVIAFYNNQRYYIDQLIQNKIIE